MQALCVWPSTGGFWVEPQLDIELVSSNFPRKYCRPKKRLGCIDPVIQRKFRAILLVSRKPRSSRSGISCRSPNFDLSSEFLSGSSKVQVTLVNETKTGYFGASVTLAWALEPQATGDDLLREEPNSGDGLSGEIESGNVDHQNLDSVNYKDDEGAKSERGIEKKSSRIDVRALAWALQSAKTADDVEEILKGLEMPLQVYSSMIKGFGREKKMKCAMALADWLKRKKKETGGVTGPNIFVYHSLLGAVKESEQFELTEKILSDMTEEGVLPNVVTYNILMSIYLEKGEATQTLNILEEFQKKGLTPSPASYSTALMAYRKLEDGNGALRFFVQLKEKYAKGEIGNDGVEDWENEFVKLEDFLIRTCFQVMRRWLIKNENLSTNVLKLLSEMDKAGLQPGQVELERLVWACTRGEHYVVAKELYNRIREQHSDISLSVVNHIIWLMGKAKKWWAALEIYEDLLDRGPKPNNMSHELIISHFNILLTAAKKRGIWKWGVRLLNKMEEKGLKPGSREWNAVLVACSKASETSAAVQIFRRMVDQGEKPTIISYGALLSALEKGKLYDEALRVWEHMLKVGVEPNVYAYTIMASVFTGQGKFKLVDAIFQEMALSGIEPTVVTYNAIISGCARNRMGSAAYEWFHRMKVQNIAPNEITYEMLIEALAKDGKPRLAYELYLRAQNEGLKLSWKAYDALVQSSEVYGATIDLSVLGPHPLERKKKPQIRKTLTEFCDLADVPRRSRPFDREEIHSRQTEESQ